jgi:hypothetical protein
MPTWEQVEVTGKTSDAPDAKAESLGTVDVPTFDENDPDKGLQDIANFDFSSPVKSSDGTELNYPQYKSWKQAVVALVNTQYGTNLRNRLRSIKTGKVSGEAILRLAYAKITMPEFQEAQSDPAKMNDLIERKKAEVKAELAARKNGNQNPSQQEIAAQQQMTQDQENAAPQG